MPSIQALRDVTGLVLAGGRGSRMGGVDKGLQLLDGRPLAQHALERLRPQVSALLVNANRHGEQYAAFGAPFAAAVVPDAQADFPGPLAGWLAGLAACRTPWLVTVPCDTPHFPHDLVARLAAALDDGADLAMAATLEDGREQLQPVFTLLRCSLHDDLAQALAAGERKIERWARRHRLRVLRFDDTAAFANANTPEELAALQRR